MQRTFYSQRYFSVPDLIVVLLIGSVIYGVVSIGNQWRADYNPVTTIDLSFWALPRYTLLSGIRGVVAYFISLGFTLVVGYAAAKSRRAEQVIIPALDILQSIPVLGFLPGLVLGLIALFPRTNLGLELAAILMIFTGQVWNMTFSYYSSLKSIPSEFNEAATVMGLTPWQRLVRLELPFSAVGLGWNSLLSMAGGWFFLSVCEAFQLGDREFRLPGIGAYMAVAVAKGETLATVAGVGAMVVLIVGMDFVVWRPILAWIRRFRLEEVPGVAPPEPVMKIMFRESRIVRWLKLTWRRSEFRRSHLQRVANEAGSAGAALAAPEVLRLGPIQVSVREPGWARRLRRARFRPLWQALEFLSLALTAGLVLYGAIRLGQILLQVNGRTWILLMRDTLWTLLRVLAALFLSTLWAVPVGIWIGTSARRTRIAQPIIQVVASFPAPMLYPLALGLFFAFGIDFSWGSMLLMMLGVQWYVLFNVLAGALRIPQELNYALSMMEASRADRWRALYLPSVFPSLVTGWVTAAGGAWNASIVAEVLQWRGTTLKTGGIGATIGQAASEGNFPLLAASLTIMVIVVLVLNRSVWARVYRLAQTRYRLDT